MNAFEAKYSPFLLRNILEGGKNTPPKDKCFLTGKSLCIATDIILLRPSITRKITALSNKIFIEQAEDPWQFFFSKRNVDEKKICRDFFEHCLTHLTFYGLQQSCFSFFSGKLHQSSESYNCSLFSYVSALKSLSWQATLDFDVLGNVAILDA